MQRVTILGVTRIANEAFHDNTPLHLVTVKANTPPILHSNAIKNAGRNLIDLVAPTNALEAYRDSNNGWTGFKSIRGEVALGETFTVNHITYQVTLVGSLNTVTVTDYNTDGGTSVTIPQTVDYALNTFAVTVIGQEVFKEKSLASVIIPDGVTSIEGQAFLNNALTSVSIPGSVTIIEHGAFRDNYLREVTIQEGVTSIGNSTFRGNDLKKVTILGTMISIGSNAFGINLIDTVVAKGDATVPTIFTNNTFSNRGEIDLVVPQGEIDAYETAGWTGFKSIREEGSTLSLNDNNDLEDFKIYPNPARDNINIQLHDGQELKQVNIYSIAGAYLYTENEVEINTARLSNGMYLFEIVTKTGDR